jgi:hypothetical protein
VLLYGEWVEENVLARVAHRQYVFTVPRLLRPLFARQRVSACAELQRVTGCASGAIEVPIFFLVGEGLCELLRCEPAASAGGRT